MSASLSEVFAATARRHPSVTLTSASYSIEAKAFARRKFRFSRCRSSRLACGVLPSKVGLMFAATRLAQVAQLVADVTQRWCAIAEPEALVTSCVIHVVGHDD